MTAWGLCIFSWFAGEEKKKMWSRQASEKRISFLHVCKHGKPANRSWDFKDTDSLKIQYKYLTVRWYWALNCMVYYLS